MRAIEPGAFTRRSFLQKSAGGAASVSIAGSYVTRALAAARAPSGRVVPLPSATQYRADVQRMVDFGPRLPGYAAHHAYCDWLEAEFAKAGLELSPCDQFLYDRWQLRGYQLEILDGPSPGPVKVAFPYVRSASTGPQGIAAPLSYGGGAPGSIFVVELPVPAKATGGIFVEEVAYLHWPGHTLADLATMDYTRPWVGPWPSDFSAFASAGAKAVIIIAGNASYEALAGGFSPHQAPQSTPIPVLIVDRDTGATLREQALMGRQARLTLDAPVQKSAMRTVTAILPGASQETIIIDTHSDGQNAIEENAGPALLGMARHFASLPPGQRLKRTLVFTIWSAHMTDTSRQPELDGWIATHQDLVKRAVGGVTLEHLGCSQWVDDSSHGYHGTGQNELYGISTTQGLTFDLAKQALVKHDLDVHALMRPPVEFTVGNFFQADGIPNVGGIAGPIYLLVVSESGEIEKLDFDLAARQIGFYADVVKAFDAADANALRAGDPTLGGPSNASPTPGPVQSTSVACAPAEPISAGGERVAVRFYGYRRHHRGVLVTVGVISAALAQITVELRRANRLYARSVPFTATNEGRQIFLRRRGRKEFPPGPYSLIVREADKPLWAQTVHLSRRATSKRA